ncbi:hypothetical protein LOTGIDRAFT_157188 [Lottia gigantea]|uniref:Uncharacterized protein n=1 Tax=Lottia gigantea TaxID=225164 RepID=V4B8G4_LOTGI|nr:hypothetical protein LOTGIDRAFT_157188 [Lottia gigantea]ESP02047.1 hypothetical protein LOTGIDRAFT_157188 [Lottia gigantea]
MTESQNLISLISKLEDKIAKQKLDIQQLIDNIPDENEDTFQQELNALKTKLNSELQKELRNIKQQIQNIDDSEIKTYIQQQIQNIDDNVIQQQITTINNLVLKQDKNIVALEKKYLKKESYYFNLPFRGLGRKYPSITDNIDKSKDYEYKKYGFTANIRVYSVPDDKYNTQKVLQFINGTKNVEIKEFEINDENNKVNHSNEIKTSGKYIDTFRMLIIPDNKEAKLLLSHFDMILETESPPSVSIIRNPEDVSSYQFLRATDFEYVKLYFVNNDIFTSIDIHKSQQRQKFLILPIRHREFHVRISISIEKTKFSVRLNKINDSKEQMSLVSVKVFIQFASKQETALSEVHLI